MSLRARVVILIGIVLLISVLTGSLFAGYEAKQTLRQELNAGLSGARRTVQSAFEDLPNSDHPQRDLHQLIATFNGNRHVQAVLLSVDGLPITASRTDGPARAPPSWFARELGPSPGPVRVAAPRSVRIFGAILLKPIAALDIDATWREFAGIVLVLMASTAAGLGLVYLLIGAALSPLQTLSEEFVRIGAGDYGGRVTAKGPSELLKLQSGFNNMAERLTSMTERNRLLTDQLLTLQDEERADIARDLHDEIGPHLFAVNMDAEMIAQRAGEGPDPETVEQARSIQSAVGHMQRHVRELLLRLRPTRVTELGFKAAVEDLTRFWAARRPDIAFQVRIDDEDRRLGETMKDIAYRVIQEAVNNAVRHGRPTAILITVEHGERDEVAVVVTDDGSPLDEHPSLEPKTGGFGLIGMRERVTAGGGRLLFGPRQGHRGWRVTARLPSVSTPSQPDMEMSA
jgi:two-component system sensor histidine kinase UhpB